MNPILPRAMRKDENFITFTCNRLREIGTELRVRDQQAAITALQNQVALATQTNTVLAQTVAQQNRDIGSLQQQTT